MRTTLTNVCRQSLKQTQMMACQKAATAATATPVSASRRFSSNISSVIQAKSGRSLAAPTTKNVRFLSSSAAGAEKTTTAETKTTTEEKPKPKQDAANLFLDNLGKIFLTAIVAVIGTLVRSSYNTSNKTKVRDFLEDTAAIDPVEIEDLRIANSELTPEVFRQIMKDLDQQYSHGSMISYQEFILSVRRTMSHLKGGAFTIELGHLLDRVAAAVLKEHKKSADEEMPMALWLTLLSLALNSSVSDRIKVLYEIMEGEEDEDVLTFRQIRPMVGYLQETCQLVPDGQVVPTETKYPTQQFRRGGPEDLVPWEGSDRDTVDFDAFASILRTKSVCAWGECYERKTFAPGE
jgi:hypothetical protein